MFYFFRFRSIGAVVNLDRPLLSGEVPGGYEPSSTTQQLSGFGASLAV